MKGFVVTPETLASEMVAMLFDADPPSDSDTILYPGVGEGPFVEAVIEYCGQHGYPLPKGAGYDTSAARLETARDRFEGYPIDFYETDFLDPNHQRDDFDYVIGNPPYVPITALSSDEKRRYRTKYETASGRFDLYILFFERSLELLSDRGRLVFITPEKFEYTKTAEPLRRLLIQYDLQRLDHRKQSIFPNHTAYPTITVLQKRPSTPTTTVVPADGKPRSVRLPTDGTRWAEHVRNVESSLDPNWPSLRDVTVRISPGMATGADSIFVFERNEFTDQFENLTRPTISGTQLKQCPLDSPVDTDSVFVCPYDDSGDLLTETELGEFGAWANARHRDRLEDRSCYENGKQWYAWHETPPMQDILREKILFRDITDEPRFWYDESGDVVPRHSVYYLVPNNGVPIHDLRDYLNSPEVSCWLRANCQRARNEYLRLQTSVVEDLPVDPALAATTCSASNASS